MKTCIGAIIGFILALIVAIALEGIVWWCVVNGICAVFDIKFHLTYFPKSIILAMVGTLAFLPFRRWDK